MKVQLYALRHVDGRYLPPGRGRNGRGFTHQEPLPPEQMEIWPPRLFHTEGAAKIALTWWLRGVTSVTVTGGYSDWEDYDVDENWHTEPMPERRREDWRVVPVTMEVGG